MSHATRYSIRSGSGLTREQVSAPLQRTSTLVPLAQIVVGGALLVALFAIATGLLVAFGG